MKCFIIFALFCVALVHCAYDESLFTDEMKKKMHDIHHKCVEETSVSEELIAGANSGKFPDEKSLKCYIKCTTMAINGMAADGTVTYEKVAEKMPEPLKAPLKHMMTECDKFESEEDLCERAFQLHKCGYGLEPDHYFLI